MGVAVNSLQTAKKVLDHGAVDNLARLGDTSARKLDASISIDRVGRQGLVRTSLSLTRNTDPSLESAQLKQISRLEENNSVTSYLRSMQSVIEGVEDTQESVLVKSIDEFFAQAKILESNSNIAMKQAFVDKAEMLAKRVTDISAKGTSLQFEADNQMKDSVPKVNATIKALFDLNHQLKVSSLPVTLHDKRDGFIKDIARYMDVKVTYGSNGAVMLQSRKNGLVLVDGENYAKFSYPGILSEAKLLNKNDHPALTMTHHAVDGKPSREPVIFMGGSGDATLQFSGGEWGGLVDVRQKVLPELIDAAKNVGHNITKAVNAIHNNGSTFPPKTRFESAISVYGTEAFNGDAFTIYQVNQDGSQLRGGAGLLNPITIDMSKIKSSQEGYSTATMLDMIKEINHALDTGPSRQRAAIGSILDGDGDQIQGQYLVNNMQIKANSVVSGTSDSLEFELELQGNSNFGSNIEVMSISTSGGYNVPTDNLPDDFRLEKGASSVNSMPITVNGINAPGKILVEVRVTGDNGVVQRGVIEYDIDPSVSINDRIAIDPATANEAGDFVDPTTVSNFTSIARAMLVDDNGIEINLETNPNVAGKLIIQTADESYRLAISGSFGQIFEFNNMFEFDEHTGKMNVNPNIVADVNQLSVGQAAQDEGADVVRSVGDDKAVATLDFAGVLADGDTVTVGGQTFIFAAVPTNQNEVLTAGGIASLGDAINNHTDISELVTATLVGSVLTLQAKNAGIGGNSIVVATNLVGGATVDLNANGANAVNNGNLQDGTDKNEVSKVYSYSIKSGSGEVIEALSNLQFNLVAIDGNGLIPSGNLSLSNLGTIFTGVLSDKLNAAEIESDISANVLEQMQTVLQDRFGIKGEEQYIKLIDTGRLLQELSRLVSMMNNIETKSQDIIFG